MKFLCRLFAVLFLVTGVVQAADSYEFTVSADIINGLGDYTYAVSAYNANGELIATADGLTVITAGFPVASKVAVTQGSSALNLSGQKSDYITVVSGTASEKYTLVSISGSKATFKGKPVEGTSFDVILSRASDYRYRSYSGQVQTAISSTDHLLYDAVLKGVTSYSAVTFTDSWAQANGGELLQNGCLLLHFYMPEDAGKLQKVTLTAPSAIFYQTNSVNGGKTASLTLDMADVDLPSDYVVISCTPVPWKHSCHYW